MWDENEKDMIPNWIIEYEEACEEAERLEEERLERERLEEMLYDEEIEYEDDDEWHDYDIDPYHEEPSWDLDMGFDPYEGLYTDDC